MYVCMYVYIILYLYQVCMYKLMTMTYYYVHGKYVCSSYAHMEPRKLGQIGLGIFYKQLKSL
jgi:hypothetical protein